MGTEDAAVARKVRWEEKMEGKCRDNFANSVVMADVCLTRELSFE